MMNISANRAARLVVATTIAVSLLVGCSGDEGDSTTTSATPVPVACDMVTDLVSVSALRASSDPDCSDWISLAAGRAVQASTGSASVWSRRTGTGTALIVGAVHTLGQGWYGPADTPIAEAVTDPTNYTGVPRLFLQHTDGTGPDSLASPWFALYNPAIASARNNNFMHDVLPREDFYVAVVDGQKIDVSGLAQVPEPVRPGLVPLHDPSGATLAAETIAAAADGELVLLLGYPDETGELTAAVGRVLDDEAARNAIATLAALGDSEGEIAYEPDVEMVIEGAAVAGMSGGPVVDREGRLVGVLVRATATPDGEHYARAVRLTWIAAELSGAIGSLAPSVQSSVATYLEK